jgi:hypothetical protein
MNNLAFILKKLGRCRGVEEMYLETLELMKMLGKEHPDTLNSRRLLALLLKKIGRSGEPQIWNAVKGTVRRKN